MAENETEVPTSETPTPKTPTPETPTPEIAHAEGVLADAVRRFGPESSQARAARKQLAGLR